VATIDELKELEQTPTPLFLFDCTMRDGSVERWSTHAVSHAGQHYRARLLRHDGFDLRASIEDGIEGAARISVTLANADSYYSQVERSAGFKGSQVVVWFGFFDLATAVAVSEVRMVFRGTGNTPEEITESALRVAFTNRFAAQRVVLPEVRIQRRCPWMFPATEQQRQEARTGGPRGRYSPLYRCGYSAGLPGGEGTLNGAEPFTHCDYTRASCEQRGMFALGRFGGIEYVPPQILVRGHGEPGTRLSTVMDNRGRYNDVVPLVYGTAWCEPPVVFARNDGNLTHMEVLLGMGEIDGVVKVVVNDVELPEGSDDADMTATGWYKLVTAGSRSGAANPDFKDAHGNLLGDPYGSMAMASVVVPNRVYNGQGSPRVRVLMRGIKLEQFDLTGAPLGASFSRNPAWVLLDVLRRAGWLLSEIDVESFARAAEYCGETVASVDAYGNEAATQRYQCNLVVRTRQSAAELVRGIRAGSALLLNYGRDGRLELRVESSLAVQHPVKPPGSNSVEALNGGWPAYEFSDGSAGFSGILRKPDGEPAIRLYARTAAETPNRFTVEFQDEHNEYQQDSLSLVDVDDATLTGREITAAFPALGIPNFDQAARILELQLAKAIRGNVYVELETSFKGVSIVPGDLITVTYLKEGLQRQPFRVIRMTPGQNFQTVRIAAQWHDDAWYMEAARQAASGRRRGSADQGLPRPLLGTEIDDEGVARFTVRDTVQPLPGGEAAVRVTVEFGAPRKPGMSSARAPLVGLNPVVETTGGTLRGAQTLYYAVSGVDGAGVESGLSFLVRARIPAGGDQNRVRLTGLSFSPETASFRVYRGPTPAQLLRIADGEPLAASFTDGGLAAELEAPPDEHYDHANFYWRRELAPETPAQIHGSTSIGNPSLGMGEDAFAGALVRITRGRGAGQERSVTGNSATTLTVFPSWSVVPDASSYFTVSEGTWKLGGVAKASPAEFPVAVLPGETIQVSGRAANALNQESAYELSPITRWQVGSGGGVDTGAPPAPVYGVSALGNGAVELAGIAFTTLDNTYGIVAGVWELFWWNELQGPPAVKLSTAISETDSTLVLNSPGGAAPNQLIQIGAEIMEVVEVLAGGLEYRVVRGAQGSVAAVHAVDAPVYQLERTTAVIPFVKGFFGSTASGTFRHVIYLPNVRVAASNLYMVNSFGNGEVGIACFGATVDQGLRTLSGGQISIQVEGYLAVQNDAAPAFVVDQAAAVGDVFAVVREAAVGGDIELTLRQDNDVYCRLTIAEGETISNVVHGLGLPALAAGARLRLDIDAVPGAANTLPGRDLTVTIRL
jgi:hypothetical protein